jgi:hypothetical protein
MKELDMMKTPSAALAESMAEGLTYLTSHTITIQHCDGGNNPRLYRMVNGNWQEMVMVPRWINAGSSIPKEVADKFERLAKAMEDII